MTIFDQAFNNELDDLKKTDDFHIVDTNQKTILHYAVLGKAFDVIRFLVETDINLNAQDISGETALFDAARKDKLQIAKLLISKHAKINIPNNKGETVLHLAALKGNIDFVKLLIEEGGHTFIKTKEDKLPAHYAIQGGHIDILKYLIDQGDILYNHVDKYKNNFLHHATKTLNEHMVKFLIEKKINVNELNEQFETPIFNAVKFSKEQIVMQLILNQAFIEIKNRRYETPIDLAKIFEKDSIYELLIRQRERPEYERFIKKYALTLAVLNRDYQEVQKLLIVHTKGYKDQYQMSPLDYALKYQFPQLIDYLKSI